MKNRGKGDFLANSKNFQLNNSKNSAFSLIELSIVLIIIGLLVAGVTGGVSLIQSARIRAFINEINGCKQAVYTFKAAKDRLPGDINNIGQFPACRGLASDGCIAINFSTETFPAPYNVAITNSNLPPWIELFLELVTDFKPVVSLGSEGILYSKAFTDSRYAFFTEKQKITDLNDYRINLNGKNFYRSLFCKRKFKSCRS